MSAKKKASAPELSVKILSPTGTLFEGKARSVTAANKVGPFDILGDHANFFSLLSASTIKVQTTSEALEFPISQGLAKCSNNHVTLFLDIETAKTPS